MSDQTRYYHGGAPGLRVGALLLPPDQRPATSCKNLVDYTEEAGYVGRFIRRDRVYVTTESKIARVFAAMKPNGALYLVEPEGELEIDPDCSDFTSWMCARAKIVKVSDPCVKFEQKDLLKYMAQLS